MVGAGVATLGLYPGDIAVLDVGEEKSKERKKENKSVTLSKSEMRVSCRGLRKADPTSVHHDVRTPGAKGDIPAQLPS